MAGNVTLAAVFQDTKRWIADNPTLRDAAQTSASQTRLYPAGEPPILPPCPNHNGNVTLSNNRTFTAARILHTQYPEARIGVLNFASATHTGGGVALGARAQEESLCRCSTLYPTLYQDFLYENYYLFHRHRHDCCYTDACIYSPDVIVCKSDVSVPERLPKSEWFPVDVITCAAPNASILSIEKKKLAALHRSRATHIFTVAAAHQIDCLVLGAFGCGAFRNNPYVVATVYRELLPTWLPYFRHIEFAVFCHDKKAVNFRAFQETLPL